MNRSYGYVTPEALTDFAFDWKEEGKQACDALPENVHKAWSKSPRNWPLNI